MSDGTVRLTVGTTQGCRGARSRVRGQRACDGQRAATSAPAPRRASPGQSRFGSGTVYVAHDEREADAFMRALRDVAADWVPAREVFHEGGVRGLADHRPRRAGGRRAGGARRRGLIGVLRGARPADRCINTHAERGAAPGGARSRGPRWRGRCGRRRRLILRAVASSPAAADRAVDRGGGHGRRRRRAAVRAAGLVARRLRGRCVGNERGACAGAAGRSARGWICAIRSLPACVGALRHDLPRPAALPSVPSARRFATAPTSTWAPTGRPALTPRCRRGHHAGLCPARRRVRAHRRSPGSELLAASSRPPAGAVAGAANRLRGRVMRRPALTAGA